MPAKSSKYANNYGRQRRPELISQQEAAARCGVHPKTIRRWTAAGLINAYRVGPRLIKVDAAELDKVLRPVGGAV